MKEIKFRYICRHKPSGNVEVKHYTLNQIEEKPLKKLSPAFSNDYEILARVQFTGLYDKNGKEIYEGDILTSHFYPFQDYGRYNYHGLVEWLDNPSGFYITKRLANHRNRGLSDGISELIEGTGHFEVIGNIHEHQHLLEVD